MPWFIQSQARFVAPQEHACYRHGAARRSISNVIHRTKSERDYRFTLAQKHALPAREHTAFSLLAAAVAPPKIVAANVAELS